MLSWLNHVDADFETAVAQRIDLAVPSGAHLRAVADAAARLGRPADVHLHVDVGMARDGAEPAAWPALCEAARTMERHGLVRVVAIMAHLGWADDPTDPYNAVARRTFDEATATARHVGLRPRLRHLAATAAALTDPRTHLDLCRIGAGLVGIDPSRTTRLAPAMTLCAPVVGVREVARGTSVGYGHTYVTERRTRLALVPVGYADGVPRAASGRGWVLVRGRRRQVVGLVSMDQLVVDVGTDPVEAGEMVTVFGPGTQGEPTVAEWARWAGTIEHEIVTGIGSRVVRRIVEAPDRCPTRACPRCGHAMNALATQHDGRVKIVVIGGGQSCEHDVSLATAASVAARPGSPAVRGGRADDRPPTANGWTAADSRCQAGSPKR